MNLIKQLIGIRNRLIQVINLSGLLDRIFRPVITPNSIRAGWVVRMAYQPVKPIDRRFPARSDRAD